jgi:hypothetical protein
VYKDFTEQIYNEIIEPAKAFSATEIQLYISTGQLPSTLPSLTGKNANHLKLEEKEILIRRRIRRRERLIRERLILMCINESMMDLKH